MDKEQVLADISSLIQDIDKCTGDYTKAKLEQDGPALILAHCNMTGLLIAAHQELSFLYDHIKVLYGLIDKADQLYFRAGALSADMNSSELLRKAREDYWHYVNYELNKEGGKDEDRD